MLSLTVGAVGVRMRDREVRSTSERQGRDDEGDDDDDGEVVRDEAI